MTARLSAPREILRDAHARTAASPRHHLLPRCRLSPLATSAMASCHSMHHALAPPAVFPRASLPLALPPQMRTVYGVLREREDPEKKSRACGAPTFTCLRESCAYAHFYTFTADGPKTFTQPRTLWPTCNMLHGTHAAPRCPLAVAEHGLGKARTRELRALPRGTGHNFIDILRVFT